MSHGEFHRSQCGGWLRAGVLGANDGLISTSSLVVAMVGAGAVTQTILVTGLSGLIAGALSMAAGEYVSVSSQADAENADEKKERGELVNQPEAELLELTGIYEKRGLTRALAEQVARELTAHDALSAHLRDELGIHEVLKARPLQAAVASAASFIVGALPPRSSGCSLGTQQPGSSGRGHHAVPSGRPRRGRGPAWWSVAIARHSAGRGLGGNSNGSHLRNRRLVWRARCPLIALLRPTHRHLQADWFEVGRGAIDAAFVEWRAFTLPIQRKGPRR